MKELMGKIRSLAKEFRNKVHEFLFTNKCDKDGFIIE